MGGYGSGQRWESRIPVERLQFIDIRKMDRNWLRPGSKMTYNWTKSGKESGSVSILVEDPKYISLQYKVTTKEGKSWPVKVLIELDSTPCNLGGGRTWMFCPQCSRRVAIIYNVSGTFACRRCHNLTYRSCNESGNQVEMISHALNRILVRLKNTRCYGFDLMCCDPKRPKGMHWGTWIRLKRQFEGLQIEYIKAMTAEMERLNVKL